MHNKQESLATAISFIVGMLDDVRIIWEDSSYIYKNQMYIERTKEASFAASPKASQSDDLLFKNIQYPIGREITEVNLDKELKELKQNEQRLIYDMDARKAFDAVITKHLSKKSEEEITNCVLRIKQASESLKPKDFIQSLAVQLINLSDLKSEFKQYLEGCLFFKTVSNDPNTSYIETIVDYFVKDMERKSAVAAVAPSIPESDFEQKRAMRDSFISIQGNVSKNIVTDEVAIPRSIGVDATTVQMSSDTSSFLPTTTSPANNLFLTSSSMSSHSSGQPAQEQPIGNVARDNGTIVSTAKNMNEIKDLSFTIVLADEEIVFDRGQVSGRIALLKASDLRCAIINANYSSKTKRVEPIEGDLVSNTSQVWTEINDDVNGKYYRLKYVEPSEAFVSRTKQVQIEISNEIKPDEHVRICLSMEGGIFYARIKSREEIAKIRNELLQSCSILCTSIVYQLCELYIRHNPNVLSSQPAQPPVPDDEQTRAIQAYFADLMLNIGADAELAAAKTEEMHAKTNLIDTMPVKQEFINIVANAFQKQLSQMSDSDVIEASLKVNRGANPDGRKLMQTFGDIMGGYAGMRKFCKDIASQAFPRADQIQEEFVNEMCGSNIESNPTGHESLSQSSSWVQRISGGNNNRYGCSVV